MTLSRATRILDAISDGAWVYSPEDLGWDLTVGDVVFWISDRELARMLSLYPEDDGAEQAVRCALKPMRTRDAADMVFAQAGATDDEPEMLPATSDPLAPCSLKEFKWIG